MTKLSTWSDNRWWKDLFNRTRYQTKRGHFGSKGWNGRWWLVGDNLNANSRVSNDASVVFQNHFQAIGRMDPVVDDGSSASRNYVFLIEINSKSEHTLNWKLLVRYPTLYPPWMMVTAVVVLWIESVTGDSEMIQLKRGENSHRLEKMILRSHGTFWSLKIKIECQSFLLFNSNGLLMGRDKRRNPLQVPHQTWIDADSVQGRSQLWLRYR